MTPTTMLVVPVVFSALFVSSIAGYGGSLLLVPALTALVGPKEGIAFAALLLGWNNLFKVTAYRSTLALRAGWPLLVITAIGVTAGASLLIAAPNRIVIWGVVTVVLMYFAAETAHRLPRNVGRRASAPLMACAAVLSGVSGSSGPLKGLSIRALGLPRLEHVGLASCVSLVGDMTKTELFHQAGLLDAIVWPVAGAAIIVMPVAAWAGRSVNGRVNENTFRWIFWVVVGSYTLRLIGLGW